MKSKICLVCGMEINQKNYKNNKEAFLKPNKDELITFCPFCGVNKEFLIDKEKYTNNILDIDSKNLNSKTLIILDHASKLEIFNSDFYKEASKMAESEEIRDMFSSLSKVELSHAKIHMKMGGVETLPVLTKINYEKYKGDSILLEQAFLREKHAIEFYSKKRNEVGNKIIAQIFDVLSNVEREHIILTEK